MIRFSGSELPPRCPWRFASASPLRSRRERLGRWPTVWSSEVRWWRSWGMRVLVQRAASWARFGMLWTTRTRNDDQNPGPTAALHQRALDRRLCADRGGTALGSTLAASADL